LQNLVNYSQLSDVEIVVADNASSDDSIQWLKENYPQVKVLQFDENYGFAGGYNRVFETIVSEYICLLNSDVDVTPNWIEPALDYLESHSDVAVVCSKLLDDNKRQYFEYSSAAGGYIDKFGYPFCQGRIFDTVENDVGQYDEIKEVLWGAGAALFVRRDAWLKVGGMDERFFAHMEEIDLCWRLSNKGYKIVYHPKSVVYHLGGGTLSKLNPKKTFLNFRNNLWMLKKNLSPEERRRIILIRFFLDSFAALFFLMKFKPADFFAVVRAWWVFMFKSKTICAKSFDVNGFPDVGFYPKSIVVDYYLRGKRKFSDLNI
jgi:GT2 family glycosyltransferase